MANKLAVREFVGVYTVDSSIDIPKEAVINRAGMSAVRSVPCQLLLLRHVGC
jgi:hypothetical protein